MHLFKLTAPRSNGKIPKGFTLQVVSPSMRPSSKEVIEALKREGFTDSSSLSQTSGNFWIIERIS